MNIFGSIDISRVFDSSDPNIKCDIYRMIIDFLSEERLYSTAGVFQDEVNMRFNETASKRAHTGRIRKFIINGDWTSCSTLISKLIPRNEQRKYLYPLHRQEYLELIDSGEHHRAFQFLTKKLKPLEDISTASSPNEMKELSYLLTCKSVTESDQFRNWKSPFLQREILAEEIVLSLTRLFQPCLEDIQGFGSAYFAPNRLITLLQQAFAFQLLCSQIRATTTTTTKTTSTSMRNGSVLASVEQHGKDASIIADMRNLLSNGPCSQVQLIKITAAPEDLRNDDERKLIDNGNQEPFHRENGGFTQSDGTTLPTVGETISSSISGCLSQSTLPEEPTLVHLDTHSDTQVVDFGNVKGVSDPLVKEEENMMNQQLFPFSTVSASSEVDGGGSIILHDRNMMLLSPSDLNTVRSPDRETFIGSISIPPSPANSVGNEAGACAKAGAVVDSEIHVAPVRVPLYPCVKRLLTDYTRMTLPTVPYAMLLSQRRIRNKTYDSSPNDVYCDENDVCDGHIERHSIHRSTSVDTMEVPLQSEFLSRQSVVDYGKIRCMTFVQNERVTDLAGHPIHVVGGTDRGLVVWSVHPKSNEEYQHSIDDSGSSSDNRKDSSTSRQSLQINKNSSNKTNNTREDNNGSHGGIRPVFVSGVIPLSSEGDMSGDIDIGGESLSGTPFPSTSRLAKIRDVACDRKGSMLVTGMSDGSVIFVRWNQDYPHQDENHLEEYSHIGAVPKGRILAHTGDVCAVSMHSDSHYCISGGFDGLVNLYDTNHLSCVKSMRGHAGAITSVECNRPGNMVISASRDGSIKFWDLLSGLCVNTLSPSGTISGQHSEESRSSAGHDVTYATISESSRYLLVASRFTVPRLLDVRMGRVVTRYSSGIHVGERGSFYRPCLLNGDEIVCGGGASGVVNLWHTQSGVLASTLNVTAPTSSSYLTSLDIDISQEFLSEPVAERRNTMSNLPHFSQKYSRTRSLSSHSDDLVHVAALTQTWERFSKKATHSNIFRTLGLQQNGILAGASESGISLWAQPNEPLLSYF